MSRFKKSRFLKIVSQYARGITVADIARECMVSRVVIDRLVSAQYYALNGYSNTNKHRKYAQKRRIQYQLLVEYPSVFKSIMEEQ